MARKPMSQMLPCPYCGHKLRVQKTDYQDEPPGRRWSTNCCDPACHSFGPMARTKRLAIEASNRRVFG